MSTPLRRRASSSSSLSRSSVRARRPAIAPLESLEQRRLLAAVTTGSLGVFDPGDVPTYEPTTDVIRDVRSGPLAKGGRALADIYAEYRRFIRGGGKGEQFESRFDDTYVMQGANLGVTLRTRGSFDGLVRLVRDSGGWLIGRNRGQSVVHAYLPIGQLRDVAAASNVLHVRPIVRPTTDVQGSVANAADRALRAEDVREALGVDGTGIKVGVISDSYNATGGASFSVATGNLPANVEVLQDMPGGSDEGRAMLELIHDVAPGAELAFHTSGDTPDAMAAAIRALRLAGCTVIVDDISFLTSSYFNGGVIGDAISEVVQKGTMYFGSQGNYGGGAFQANPNWFQDSSGQYVVDFDSDPDRVDSRMTITVDQPLPFFLQWDNPYNGVTGSATADVDIRFYDNTVQGGILYKGEDNNIATGVPMEMVLIDLPGTYEVEIAVNNLAPGASLPTVFRLFSRGGYDARKAEYVPNLGYAGTLGYRTIPDSISVAAIDYAATAAAGSVTAVPEDFSGTGGGLLLFKENGQRRAAPASVQKPDFTSVDGVNTATTGFAPFFGTSAAAPNAAAVAALLRQVAPDASPATIRDAMTESAKANPINGQAAGAHDTQTGFGLLDAVAAAQVLDPTLVSATIERPSVNPKNNGVGSLTIRFSAPVTGFDLGDITVRRGEDGDDLVRRSRNSITQLDPQTYVLEGLRRDTQVLGTYLVDVDGAGVRDANDRPVAGDRTSFTIELREPADLRATALANGAGIRLVWADRNGNNTGYRLQRSTDPGFASDVQSWNLDAGEVEDGQGSATWTDESDLIAGRKYYYRVRATLEGGTSGYATASAVTTSAGEIIVDQPVEQLPPNVLRLDGYEYATDSSAYGGDYAIGTFGSDVVNDNDRNLVYPVGKADRGTYFFYVRWVNTVQNAEDVTYVVQQQNADGSWGDVRSETLDQNARRSGGWVPLGQVTLDPKRETRVVLDTDEASGTVVADAIRLLPTSTPGLDNIGQPTTAAVASKSVKGSLVGSGSLLRSDEDDAVLG